NIIAEYPIGILKDSKYPAEAAEFIDLVKSEQGRAILEEYGFAPVADSAEGLAQSGTAAAPSASATFVANNDQMTQSRQRHGPGPWMRFVFAHAHANCMSMQKPDIQPNLQSSSAQSLARRRPACE